MITELVIVVLALLAGCVVAMVSNFSAHVKVGLFPQILTLNLWEALVSGYFYAWAWMKNPMFMFWFAVIITPIVIALKLTVKEERR